MPGANVVSINVFHHPDSILGNDILKGLTARLYNDGDINLQMDFKVPVFSIPYLEEHRSLPHFDPIQWDKYDFIFVVVIMDDLFTSDASNTEFLKTLILYEKAHSNFKIIPVVPTVNITRCDQTKLFIAKNIMRPAALLQDNPFDIPDTAEFITSLFFIEFYHIVIREMINANGSIPVKKVELFLSHTKLGGVEITRKIRSYVAEITQLANFMDVYDIPIAETFEEELMEAIEKPNSVFISILTDNYSSRQVCKMEALWAKKRQRPILTINALHNFEKRSFPYLNNTPVIRWEDSSARILSIIEASLREFLRMLVVATEMINFVAETKVTVDKHLFFPPELLTLSNLADMKFIGKDFVVIYPNPVLDQQEQDILALISPHIKFITPWQVL